jgi:hypothetical protein
VNILSVVLQMFVVSRLVKWLGMGGVPVRLAGGRLRCRTARDVPAPP